MLTRLSLLACFVVMAACGPTADDNGGGDPMGVMPDAAEGSMPDASTVNGTAPGGSCSCDADCQDVGSHEGVCIYGICMTEASGACASGGSQAECPTGSQCWNLSGHQGSLCWPECATYDCKGKCASDGTCEPTAQTDCDPTCGTACSCTETSCGAGNRCVNGECVPDVGAGPGAGPGPTCSSLPTRDCASGCSTLSTFSPRTTAHYDDYPINGETSTNQYRSYLRKDLMMLVAYATAKTHCKSAMWTVGNGGALGLGDMSEANGAIPGTAVGSPGHPQGTHTNGYDIDLAYYQAGTADNKLRAVCPHVQNNQDQYHCTGDPTYLDPWRTAMFLGYVFESSRTRVIGVDGKIGPLMISALDYLCDNGWMTTASCGQVALAYETTNGGAGWYHFHHHHAHISLKQSTTFTDYVLGCKSPFGCDPSVRRIPKRDGIHRLQPAK